MPILKVQSKSGCLGKEVMQLLRKCKNALQEKWPKQ